jgi:hypothetical protein
MKATYSSAPLLELGPRMAVPSNFRGCKGCKYFSDGLCVVEYGGKGTEPPFWVYTGRRGNTVSPNEGFSCARWENRDGKES